MATISSMRSAAAARQHTGRSHGMLANSILPVASASFSNPRMLTPAEPVFTKLPPHDMQATAPLGRATTPAPLALWSPASSQPKPVLSTNTKRDATMVAPPPVASRSLSNAPGQPATCDLGVGWGMITCLPTCSRHVCFVNLGVRGGC